MNDITTAWISADDLIFDRLKAFHRQRVESLIAGSPPLPNPKGGFLVVHLVPQECHIGRSRFSASELKGSGHAIPPLGERNGQPRFNIDGFMTYSGSGSIEAYTQLLRDGRLEAAAADIVYEQNGASFLRVSMCERGIFQLVEGYLKFCKSVGLIPPIWLFASLANCKGVRIASDPRWASRSDNAIDRSPAYIPEIEIKSLDITPMHFLRPLCDVIWQAAGIERSINYDQEGKWHEPR